MMKICQENLHRIKFVIFNLMRCGSNCRKSKAGSGYDLSFKRYADVYYTKKEYEDKIKDDSSTNNS